MSDYFPGIHEKSEWHWTCAACSYSLTDHKHSKNNDGIALYVLGINKQH